MLYHKPKQDFAPRGSKVKINFKKHIVPPLLGFGAMILCLGFFNSQLIAGKVSHAAYKEPVDSSALDTKILSEPLVADSPDSRLIINKLQVNAPTNFSLSEINEHDFQIALRDGVVHYPNTGIPGEPGNVVIFGHSSNQVWAKGNYKFVFATLDKLKKDDSIIIDYEGKRFIYKVTGTKVVKPTDLSVLNGTTGHRLTLITCTPVGSNTSRLIVEAEQVAPQVGAHVDTEKLTPTVSEELYGKEQLPGDSKPSLWESIKSLF